MQNAISRMEYINKGEVCSRWNCEYPEPDRNGWCVNCGYPVTQKTQKEWEGFSSLDRQHAILIKKLMEWKGR